jgi:type I restriction enzyme, S subunit
MMSNRFHDIPVEWEINLLDNVLEFIGSGITPKGGKSVYLQKGIPFIRSQNVYPNGLKMDDVVFIDYETHNKKMARSKIKENDVLLNITGASIGRCTFVPTGFGEANVNQHVCILRPNSKVDYRFLSIFLNSFYGQIQIREEQAGQTREGLNYQQIRKFKLPVPPLHEQRKIASILKSIDNAIEKTEAIIKQTEVLKQGLMQQLLTKGIGHTRFKQTEFGEIPETWEIFTLENMLEYGFILGHQDGNHGELYPRAGEFIEKGIPYLSANCIKDGEIDFSLAKFLSVERAQRFKKGVAIDKDVLFAHNATVGPVSVLNTKLDFVILSTTLTYYRCNEEKVNPYYLSQYMSSPTFIGQYTRVMGQTTRNQVPLTLQRKFFHVIPPIEEQNRITKILSSVDSKVQVEKKKLTTLLEVKKGLVQDLLTGKVRVNVNESSEVSV